MIGGQVLDMIYGNKNNPYIVKKDHDWGTQPTPDFCDIEQMYRLKTGALLSAACQLGLICGDEDVSDETLEKADAYAMKMGLAFQIKDDILDIESDERTLGKPIHSDLDSGKLTYVSMTGLDNAKRRASELTEQAIAILQQFPNNESLYDITIKMLYRDR
jgi:geranylgeranyl pyrophosphate synthase